MIDNRCFMLCSYFRAGVVTEPSRWEQRQAAKKEALNRSEEPAIVIKRKKEFVSVLGHADSEQERSKHEMPEMP